MQHNPSNSNGDEAKSKQKMLITAYFFIGALEPLAPVLEGICFSELSVLTEEEYLQLAGPAGSQDAAFKRVLLKLFAERYRDFIWPKTPAKSAPDATLLGELAPKKKKVRISTSDDEADAPNPPNAPNAPSHGKPDSIFETQQPQRRSRRVAAKKTRGAKESRYDVKKRNSKSVAKNDDGDDDDDDDDEDDDDVNDDDDNNCAAKGGDGDDDNDNDYDPLPRSGRRKIMAFQVMNPDYFAREVWGKFLSYGTLMDSDFYQYGVRPQVYGLISNLGDQGKYVVKDFQDLFLTLLEAGKNKCDFVEIECVDLDTAVSAPCSCCKAERHLTKCFEVTHQAYSRKQKPVGGPETYRWRVGSSCYARMMAIIRIYNWFWTLSDPLHDYEAEMITSPDGKKQVPLHRGFYMFSYDLDGPMYTHQLESTAKAAYKQLEHIIEAAKTANADAARGWGGWRDDDDD
jgi:hypothetical protein